MRRSMSGNRRNRYGRVAATRKTAEHAALSVGPHEIDVEFDGSTYYWTAFISYEGGLGETVSGSSRFPGVVAEDIAREVDSFCHGDSNYCIYVDELCDDLIYTFDNHRWDWDDDEDEDW